MGSLSSLLTKKQDKNMNEELEKQQDAEKHLLDKLPIGDVSGSLTPFWESIKLLRDLADLQNGAPLEQHRQEWEETMEQVYDFLNRLEGQ